MTFPGTLPQVKVFLLVVFLLTPPFPQVTTSTQFLNTGTVLFTNMDSLACCLETERYATLVFRELLTSVIAVPLNEVKGDAYVVAFVTFVHASARKVVTNTPPVVARSFVFALFDTAGGYLRTYLLPVSVEGFYAGNVRFNEIRKLFSLYSDIKDYLHTNGKGWRPPMKRHGVHHQVRPINLAKTLEDETQECGNFLMNIGENASQIMPIPFLDDQVNPRSIALPLRYGALHSIESFESAYLVLGHYVRSMQCLQTKNVGDAALVGYNAQFKMWLVSSVIPRLKDEKWYPAFGGILRVLRAVSEGSQNTNKTSNASSTTKTTKTTTVSPIYQVRKKRLIGAVEYFKNKRSNEYDNEFTLDSKKEINKKPIRRNFNPNETRTNQFFETKLHSSEVIGAGEKKYEISDSNYFRNKNHKRFSYYTKQKDEQNKTSNVNSSNSEYSKNSHKEDWLINKVNYKANMQNKINVNDIEFFQANANTPRNRFGDIKQSDLTLALKGETFLEYDDFVPIEEMILRKFMLPHHHKEDYVTSVSLWREPIKWNTMLNNRLPRNDGSNKISNITTVNTSNTFFTRRLQSKADPEIKTNNALSSEKSHFPYPAEIPNLRPISTYDYENRKNTLNEHTVKNIRNVSEYDEIPKKRKLKYGEVVTSHVRVHSTTDESLLYFVKSPDNKLPNVADQSKMESFLGANSHISDEEEELRNETPLSAINTTNATKATRTICMSTCIAIEKCEKVITHKSTTIKPYKYSETTTVSERTTSAKKRPLQETEIRNQDQETEISRKQSDIFKTTTFKTTSHKGVKISKGIVYHQGEKVTVKYPTLKARKTKNRPAQWKNLEESNGSKKMRSEDNKSEQQRSTSTQQPIISLDWHTRWHTSTPVPVGTGSFMRMFGGTMDSQDDQWINITDTCVHRIWDGRHAAAPLITDFLCDVLQSPIFNIDFYACHILITLFIWILLFCASLGNDEMQWRWGLDFSQSTGSANERDRTHAEAFQRPKYPTERLFKQREPRQSDSKKRDKFPFGKYIRQTTFNDTIIDPGDQNSNEPRMRPPPTPIAAFMDHRFRCIPWEEKGTRAEKTPLYSTSKSTTLPPSTTCLSQPFISSESRATPKNTTRSSSIKRPPVQYLMPMKKLKFSSESELAPSEDERNIIDEP